MSHPPHRVRRLRWDVRATSEADGFALRTLLSESGDVVERVLDGAFGERAAPRTVRRVRTLELHVQGTIDDLRVDLPRRVAAALEVALASAEATVERTSAADARTLLAHYLETGSLHWSQAGLAPHEARAALEAAAVEVAEQRLSSGEDLDGDATRSPSARAAAAMRLAALLPRDLGERLTARSGSAPSRETPGVDAQRVPASAPPRVPAIRSDPAPRDGERTTAAARMELASIEIARADIRAEPAARDGERAAAAARTELASIEVARAEIRAAERERSASAVTATLGAALPEQARTDADPRDVDAGLLVPSAGLVLLHPYLRRLLETLGLYPSAGRGPLAPDVVERALAVLHWLATGRDEAQEYELAFAKVLLGLRPDEPLARQLTAPTELEREECAALLAAAIGHWSALRGTSVDSLRVGFLQRRGLLERVDGSWRLRVHAEPFDMLIAQLPWSLSTIVLPWSEAPIHVDWRTP